MRACQQRRFCCSPQLWQIIGSQENSHRKRSQEIIQSNLLLKAHSAKEEPREQHKLAILIHTKFLFTSRLFQRHISFCSRFIGLQTSVGKGTGKAQTKTQGISMHLIKNPKDLVNHLPTGSIGEQLENAAEITMPRSRTMHRTWLTQDH